MFRVISYRLKYSWYLWRNVKDMSFIQAFNYPMDIIDFNNSDRDPIDDAREEISYMVN